MPKATFRFYEELNKFLPKHRRKTDFELEVSGRRSIKDMMAALGVSLMEIDLILVNANSVDFNFILQDGDRVSVYPVFESLNISGVTRLRKTALRRNKFIADTTLGHIVGYMRALGYDTYYDSTLSRRGIIELSKRENRIILTKSRKLLKSNDVSRGILIRPGTISEQISQIIYSLDIKDMIKPFSRCLNCNTPLIKKKNIDKTSERTNAFGDEYVRCRPCNIINREGVDYIVMKKIVEQG